jgi:transcriptional regulator
MYLRPVHTDLHLPTLYKFIQTNPLGILTTAIQSSNFPLIQSSHIPWVLDIPSSPVSQGDSNTTNVGRLRGHIARANPQCKAFLEAAARSPNIKPGSKNGIIQEEVMVLFNGPVHHYVTPKFYVETKPSTGKVVPTWNYSAVQAYGVATVFFDTSDRDTGEFLKKQLDDLSAQSEASLGYTGTPEGKGKPWKVNDAPESYVELKKKGIIGIEIEIKSLAGKWKMSQELANGDMEGVVEGFEKLGTWEGDEIARTVKERGELKDREKAP